MGFFGRKRAPSVPHPRKEPRFDGPLTLKRLEQIFQDCVDFTKRPVSLGEGGACTLTLCYLSGMVKMERVSDYVLRPLATCAGWPRTRRWPAAGLPGRPWRR